MKRVFALVLACLVLLLPSASTAAGRGVEQWTSHHRNVVGKVVRIMLQNYEQNAVTLESAWTITNVRSGELVSRYDFSQPEQSLGPGETIQWDWPQDDACYGICRNVREGQPVGSGIYEASVETSLGTSKVRFQIGRYFTIGFTSRPEAKFIVYVNTPDEVAQMEAEAAAEDKTLIVSGIVRSGQPYNPDWKFAMRPGSIVLGEMFIEVCDGSPYYVERNRDEWYGERWCPWSSYVEKVGR
ncbi:MAG: hypothetical protein ACLGIB_06105 [Actinomycetota bacterium]